MTYQVIKDSRGNVTTIFAVTVAAMLCSAGLASIAADMLWTSSRSQDVLDTAVLAAASAPYGTPAEERIAIAERIYKGNQKILNAAPADISATAAEATSFAVAGTHIKGKARVARKSPFLGLFGANHVMVNVESEAVAGANTPICVLGLDGTETETMDFNGWASLTVNNCATQTNSSNGTGMHQVGNPTMTAKEIGVTGGYSGSSYSPPPITGTPPVTDPLASLPEPSPGPCAPSSGAFLQQANLTIDPGTYCGGLSIKAQSVVRMNPGIYIMKDGPLMLDSGAVVTGDNVMIAFIGPDSTLYLYGGATLSVTSPTAGTYANIQFFGDRKPYPGPGANGTFGPNLWFSVVGDCKLTYDGVIYTPSFHIWFAGGSIIDGKSPNYLAIAKKLWFQDNTKTVLTQVNTRGLDVPASVPLQYGARLVR